MSLFRLARATGLLGAIFVVCALLATLGWLFERCTDFMEVTR